MSASYDSALPPSNGRWLGFFTQVLPAFGYTSAIFYGGLIRMRALPEVGFVPTDKLLHALAFGGLALLLARALHWWCPSWSLRKKLVLGVAGSSLLGMLLELCQLYVPYRSADVLDWLADTIGAIVIASACLALLARILRRRHG